MVCPAVSKNRVLVPPAGGLRTRFRSFAARRVPHVLGLVVLGLGDRGTPGSYGLGLRVLALIAEERYLRVGFHLRVLSLAVSVVFCV